MKYAIHLISGLSALFVAFLTAGGYLVLGMVLFLESVPILGSFIPGHIVIIAAGFLAKLGILGVVPVIIIGTVATIFGDLLCFLLGRRFGNGVLHRLGKLFRVKNEYIEKTLEKTKSMIDAHAGKTIVLGKFSPITRSLTPFIVGANGVHPKTFWFYNIIGGFLWVFLSVMVGYIFGASYHAIAGYFGKFIMAALLASVCILWCFNIANKRFHIFRKYEIFVLGLNIAALWTLGKTIQDSFSLHSFMSNFDVAMNIFMAEHVTHLVEKIALAVSLIGGTVVMLFLGLAVGVGFLLKKKWRRGAIMVVAVLSTSVAASLMKQIFMRVRPRDALMVLTDPSFPSGHASLAAAFFVALAYVLVPKIDSMVKRELFIVFCVLAVIAIGVSRVVLNVHWASDVIAGWALGTFLATASVLFIRYCAGIFIKKQE